MSERVSDRQCWTECHKADPWRKQGRGGNRGGNRGGRGGGRGGSNANGGGQSSEKKPREAILDLGRFVDKEIRVKFQGGREVIGVLKGYDQLQNLVLDEVREEPTGMCDCDVYACGVSDHIPFTQHRRTARSKAGLGGAERPDNRRHQSDGGI
jgi:small nuclear ribonucleoprotein (snRNP)-like protein